MPNWAPEPPVPLPRRLRRPRPRPRRDVPARQRRRRPARPAPARLDVLGRPQLVPHLRRRSTRPAIACWRSTTAATGAASARAEPFTLKDCADDAAALLAHLKIQPVLAVGYSMGGPIASLLARDHPELRRPALVLGATAMDWSGRRMRTFWRTMAALRLALGLAPERLWQRGLRAGGFPESRDHHLGRGGAQPRQLGRHRRGRPRARALRRDEPGSPASTHPRAVIVTTAGHRRPAVQAARARGGDERARVRGPRRPRRRDRREPTSSTPSCSRRSTPSATRGPPRRA